MLEKFKEIRNHSERICAPLKTEDYVVQPVEDVSPPRWHLAHTTWFFETFILKPNYSDYQEFHPDYNFLFNSYYENVGERTIRAERGFLTRPTVEEIYAYRQHVNQNMEAFLSSLGELTQELKSLIELGLQHEQQHQELLMTDIKLILGSNPLFPAYDEEAPYTFEKYPEPVVYHQFPEGIYEIGYQGDGFCFDNELGAHKVLLEAFEVMDRPVTNREYLEFMADGGYTNFNLWLAEAWATVSTAPWRAPFHWHERDGEWWRYTLKGLKKIDLDQPVTHISYYEADAYARWKGERLLTEFEWEVAHPKLRYGQGWEWTGSAYLPYPRFKTAEGAIGEYNGKFMISQMVLRGGSIVSPPGHVRPTYRNFFHPWLRWQFNAIRLAR